MQAGAFFGFKCPYCGSSADIIASVGASEPTCPSCHRVMVPNPQARPSAANVYCPRCSIAVGLINSDTCPSCGGAWQRMPA